MKYKVDREIVCKLVHIVTQRLFVENLSREELDYLGDILNLLEQIIKGK